MHKHSQQFGCSRAARGLRSVEKWPQFGDSEPIVYHTGTHSVTLSQPTVTNRMEVINLQANCYTVCCCCCCLSMDVIICSSRSWNAICFFFFSTSSAGTRKYCARPHTHSKSVRVGCGDATRQSREKFKSFNLYRFNVIFSYFCFHNLHIAIVSAAAVLSYKMLPLHASTHLPDRANTPIDWRAERMTWIHQMISMTHSMAMTFFCLTIHLYSVFTRRRPTND